MPTRQERYGKQLADTIMETAHLMYNVQRGKRIVEVVIDRLQKRIDEVNKMGDAELCHQLTKPQMEHHDNALKKVALSRILPKLSNLSDVESLIRKKVVYERE